MKTNTIGCSLCCFLALLSWHRVRTLQCGVQEFKDNGDQCVPCIHCSPGQEPDMECGYGRGLTMSCRRCAPGTFSDTYGLGSCRPHVDCEGLKRTFLSLGTVMVDTVCGHCLPGYYVSDGSDSHLTECLLCSSAPMGTAECSERSAEGSPQAEASKSSNRSKDGTQEEKKMKYAVFLLMPVFCVIGLLGILVCNLLKKKGYRCTSEKDAKEGIELETKYDSSGGPFRTDEANEDTIGVLIKLITEKKENAAALQEMLREHEMKEAVIKSNAVEKFVPLLSIPKLCKHHHLHTVQTSSLQTGSSCMRCNQKKWPDLLLTKAAKPSARASRPGEYTILSVGRFRVARIPEQRQSLNESESQSLASESPATQNETEGQKPPPDTVSPTRTKDIA
uniref:Tumor necrosis factor receptor superfamily member 19L n=1 Tax=Callorhinchus milii TaxID=7868 RepID=A0A4W3JZL5_CALMI|eukprot:gi/632948058/ref/XP_007889384.1/ PREDICTED: tumor necrosis factor receptor superfamily member 19L [Callorhinchus milii]